MNSKSRPVSRPGVCACCGHQFTEWGWAHRHHINQTDAHLHQLEVGNYHDQCCPLPACTTAPAGKLAFE